MVEIIKALLKLLNLEISAIDLKVSFRKRRV